MKREHTRAYLFGFSSWGFRLIRDFFPRELRIRLCRTLEEARAEGLDAGGEIYAYPARMPVGLEAYAEERNLPLYRVEDGFIRSLTLGSSFFKPASMVFDSRGIYFDPSRPSDLEHILANRRFDRELLERARKLRERILRSRLSKYNHLPHKTLTLDEAGSRKRLLVVGQVDDDLSILRGGYGYDSLKLLRRVRADRPDAFILYKPHPDVVAGIREGRVARSALAPYADRVVETASLDSCIEACDEVHTITSLSGFEALMRGKEVHTYGMPFYAGWGLTVDARTCARRTRRLELDALVAAVYLLYPRYVSLETGESCGPEQVLDEIARLQERYFEDPLFRWRIDLTGRGAVVLRKILDRIRRRG